MRCGLKPLCWIASPQAHKLCVGVNTQVEMDPENREALMLRSRRAGLGPLHVPREARSPVVFGSLKEQFLM